MYAEWIKANVQDPHRACAEATLAMQRAFPELRRVRGHYIEPFGGEHPHWWLVTPAGDIVDPTAAQFNPGGMYDPWDETLPEPTGKCVDCGGLVFDGSSFCSDLCRQQTAAYLNGFRLH